MSDVQRLLWVDCESTGLLSDPTAPTLLEVSWAVTDPTGWHQYTPLAHRFTMLPAVTDPAVVGDVEHAFTARFPQLDPDNPHDPDADVQWHRWTPRSGGSAPVHVEQGPVTAVREMHARNGLDREWATYHAAGHRDTHGRPAVITDWQVLAELLHADLVTAGWDDLDPGSVALAGGGVNHYEHRFLPATCPQVFGDPRTHYAAVDVSTVLRSLALRTTDHGATFPLDASGEQVPGEPFPGRADSVLGWARRQKSADDWAHLLISACPDRWAATDTTSLPWAELEVDNHRAAPGIARAIMAYRLLPEIAHAYLDDYRASRAR